MVGRLPPGYRRTVLIDGGAEVELKTPPGDKVEYTFRLIK
jgi:hypothetical protein